ncbi:MAG: DNA polymerase III subunit beta [Bacteroidetes bacterium]|nr:DNA polymerase III subunit beta [Bacteroidota bacterium]
MKFIVSSSALLKPIEQIAGVINPKSVLPILDYFLFDLKKGRLTISATDLETSMTTVVNVESNADGKIAVPSKIILETLKALPEQPLTFNADTETLNIEIVTDSGRYKLSGQKPDDFPKMPKIESASSVTVKAASLGNAISKTIFATGTDEMRQALTGVLFELKKDGINFVATDANRLVRFKNTAVKPSEEISFVIPKKALNLLKASLPNADDAMAKIDYNKSNAFFSFGEVNLICRLIDEKYPDYKAVIPLENPNKLLINRLEFLGSIRRISIFSNKSTHQVRLKMAGSSLTVSAEDLDFSNEAKEELGCTYDGVDMEIGFNARFLSDMLSSLQSDDVVLNMSTPNRAGVLVPSTQNENEEITMLVMPLMLNTYN